MLLKLAAITVLGGISTGFRFDIRMSVDDLISPQFDYLEEDENDHDEEPLDLGKLDTLWIPDLDIYNLSKIESFKIVRSLAGAYMVKVFAYFYSI